MFSDICRACMCPLKKPENIVPLYEAYNNIYYLPSMICNTMQITLEYNDNLGSNVCRRCAKKIMEFYDFRLMFIESDRKLRDLLATKLNNQPPSKRIKNELTFDDVDDIIDIDDQWNDDEENVDDGVGGGDGGAASISSGLNDADDIDDPNLNALLGNQLPTENNPNWRWKCNACFATFQNRKQLREHRRVQKHGRQKFRLQRVAPPPTLSFNEIWIDENPTQNCIIPDELESLPPKTKDELHRIAVANDLDFRWVCRTCSARFKTRSLLYDHRKMHKKTDENVLLESGFEADASSMSYVEPETILDDGDDDDMAETTTTTTTTTSMDDTGDSSNFRWACKKCPRRFPARTGLRAHMREHRREFDLKKQALIKSIQKSTVVKTEGECSTVNVGDDDDFLPDWLQPSGSTESRWKCKRCPLSFETRSLLHLHSAAHRIKRPPSEISTVKTADDSIDTESKIEQKIENIVAKTENISPQEPDGFRWKCNKCSETFEFRKHLRLHMKIHRNEPRAYPEHRKPTRHRITKDADPNRWLCNICGVSCTRRSMLREHRRDVHNINKTNYLSFVKREPRINIHFGEYICDICDKHVYTRRSIHEHMKIHSGTRKPKQKQLCSLCGCWLSSLHNLKIHHRVVHNGVREFPCPHCPRRFSFGHHLRAHINRHIGHRPYSCDECDKKFFEPSNLNEHVKSVHLNAKVYNCNVCEKSFNRSGNLNAHLLTHSNRYPHQCGHCNLGFVRKYKLVAHLEQCRKAADVTN